MHNELIKRLRDAAKMSEALAVLLPNSGGNATAKLYNDAADAIEELSKRVPLVPQGRLIDAEAVYQFAKEQIEKETGAFSKGFNKAMKIIMAAARNPNAICTVIPASKEEER